MIDIEKERLLFEAAGTKLHGWGPHDYRRPEGWNGDHKTKHPIPYGDYTWLEQSRAFALWLEARAIRSAA